MRCVALAIGASTIAALKMQSLEASDRLQSMRHDDMVLDINASNGSQQVLARQMDEPDCEVAPTSQACLDKILCPVVACLVSGGHIQPKGPKGEVTQEEGIKALMEAFGTAEDSAWLFTIDALYANKVPLFDLPSNHLGNTGIRRAEGLETNKKGRVDTGALETLFQKFHQTVDGQEVMCLDDMKKASDHHRGAVVDPLFELVVFADARGTVYGTPVQRDLMFTTLFAVLNLFGTANGDDDACLTKSEMETLFLQGQCLPVKSKPDSTIVQNAQKKGFKIFNAKWHSLVLRTEFERAKLEGRIPADSEWNDNAIQGALRNTPGQLI